MPAKKMIFFPYEFADEELNLEVTDLQLDGEEQKHLVNKKTCTVTLPADGSWGNGKLGVQLALPPGKVKDLFPDDEQATPPWSGLVTLSCEKTRWRQGFPLQPQTGNGPAWAGQLQFERARLRGLVKMQAFLVRLADRPTPRHGYAGAQAARVASAPEWHLHVDAPPLPPGHYLDIRWEDFRTSTHARRSKNPALLYYLDFNGALPVLWLNEAIPNLKPVLMSPGTHGPKVWVRNVLFDSIAQNVWVALVLQAAHSVPAEETEPPEEWQRAVLERMAPAVYPGVDEELACEQLVKEARDPTRAGMLLEALTTAVQSRLNISKSTTNILGILEE
jgi:hypothetical protein